MSTARSALIVANYEFQDPGLRQLRAPAHDAEALAEVLADPEIGDFEVDILLNQPSYQVDRAIERFFRGARKDDLLLLHFSGHGVKDETGDLYFAVADTDLGLLGSTAVASESVNRWMNRSRARRAVLLLDCCYAGAFERGMASKSDAALHLPERLGGRGRAVITASTAMEYAFEGKDLSDGSQGQPSVFTSALVEGLRTGEADTDQDGAVGLDELYDYVYEKVRSTTPNQTPSKWALGFEGELVIARRSTPVGPAPLPAPLIDAIESPFASVRVGAVQELERMLGGSHIGRALTARMSLERLTDDDSRSVRDAAVAALAPLAGTPDLHQPTEREPDEPTEPQPDQPPEPQPDQPTEPQPDQPPEREPDHQHEAHPDEPVDTEPEPEPEPESLSGPFSSTAAAEAGQRETDTADAAVHEAPEQSTEEDVDEPDGPEDDSRRRPGWLTGRTGVLVGAGSAVAVLVILLAVVLLPQGDQPPEGGPGGDETGEPTASPTQPLAEIPAKTILATARVDEELGLYMVDTGTGDVERLRTAREPKLPTIAPDRRWLVYLTVDPATELDIPRRISADGTRDRPLFNGSTGCSHSTRPAWNESGDQMSFVCTDGPANRLFLAKGNGRNGQPLELGVVPTGAPSWGMYDGAEGVYYEVADPADETRTSLWWVDPAGDSQPHRVPENASDQLSYTHPDYGKGALLYLRKEPGRKGPRADTGTLVVLPDGEQPRDVVDGVRSPAWAPDGKRFTYLKGGRLWLGSEDDPEATELQLGDLEPRSPAWGSR